MAEAQEPSNEQAIRSTLQPIVLPCGVDDEIELRIVIELKRKPSATEKIHHLSVQAVEGGTHGGKTPGTLRASLGQGDLESAG